MRRRATILDVLKDAQREARAALENQQPGPAEVAPAPDKPAGASAWFEASLAWLRRPLALRRGFAVLGGLAGVFLLAVTFAVGVEKGRNSMAFDHERRTEPERDAPRVPGPMKSSYPASPAAEEKGASPAGEKPGPLSADQPEATPKATGTPGAPVGFRITSYAQKESNVPYIKALRSHLEKHLQGTDATAAWLRDGQEYIVAVVFPAERQTDTAYQDRLFESLRRIPPPDRREVTFDFSRLERSLIRGVIK